jgi:hypothetical protein
MVEQVPATFRINTEEWNWGDSDRIATLTETQAAQLWSELTTYFGRKRARRGKKLNLDYLKDLGPHSTVKSRLADPAANFLTLPKPQKVDLVKKMQQQGHTIKAIASQFGIPKGTVSSYLYKQSN